MVVIASCHEPNFIKTLINTKKHKNPAFLLLFQERSNSGNRWMKDYVEIKQVNVNFIESGVGKYTTFNKSACGGRHCPEAAEAL